MWPWQMEAWGCWWRGWFKSEVTVALGMRGGDGSGAMTTGLAPSPPFSSHQSRFQPCPGQDVVHVSEHVLGTLVVHVPSQALDRCPSSRLGRPEHLPAARLLCPSWRGLWSFPSSPHSRRLMATWEGKAGMWDPGAQSGRGREGGRWAVPQAGQCSEACRTALTFLPLDYASGSRGPTLKSP